MNLLLIEDSKNLVAALRDGLGRLGYAVDAVTDGRTGIDYARAKKYDVVVLDLMLPAVDGWAVLQRLRAERNPVPILILSAKDQPADRVRGLQMGADDYLGKPFSFDELCARIASLIRRKYAERSPVLVCDAVEVNTATRTVSCGGQVVHMTPGEYAVLEMLAFNRGRVMSLARLVEAIHDSDTFTNQNVIQVMICNVRKKLAAAGATTVIQTRRGIGYLVE